MAGLILNDLEDDIRDKLNALAAEHGRTVEEEAQDLLRNAILHLANGHTGKLGSRLLERFRGFDLQDGEIEEIRGQPARPADFD